MDFEVISRGSLLSRRYQCLLQVTHLDVLARLLILRYQYGEAAAVYEALAMRKQGLGDRAVDLPDRVELYRSAVLQVRLHATVNRWGLRAGLLTLLLTESCML